MPLESMSADDRDHARTFARSMLLKGHAVSDEAQDLVTHLIQAFLAPAKAAQGQLRPSTVANYRKALEAFLADLLRAPQADKWSMLATNTNAVRAYPGGEVAFKDMRKALQDAGLIEALRGYSKVVPMFGQEKRRSHRTCLRPTSTLLGIVETFGVGLDDLPRHFALKTSEAPARAAVLEARAEKVKNKPPRCLPVDEKDPKAAAIIADLERLNAYLMAHGRIEGIVFAGLRRIFSNADLPGFNWQWLGRYYSMPGADRYENMRGGSTARAKVIKIDGEAVTEVDFSASHLTILHGLLELPFDPSEDPYALPGMDREKVKAWLTTALGASDPHIGGNRYKAVREAGLQRYPFLKDLTAYGIDSLALQFHEAEIMRLAMEDLMVNDIGFLPVHDALIVPASKREEAASAMRGAVPRYLIDHLGKNTAPEARIA